jgi:DNA-binding beta-propeller fold protein YncE
MKNIRIFVPVIACLALCFFIFGCGSVTSSGGGGGSSAKGILYVSYYSDHCVRVFDNASIIDGNSITASRIISGAATGISEPNYFSLHIDTVNNELYVGDFDNNSILVFANASTASGDVTPVRTIQGGNTRIHDPRGIAVDTDRNWLYVANGGTFEVLVFTREATGNVTPERRMAGADSSIFYPQGIALDQAHDRLYIAQYTSPNNIIIFDGVSTLDVGTSPYSRYFTNEAIDGIGGICYDPSRDLLIASMSGYFYGSTSGECIWTNASTIGSTIHNVPPNRQIKGSNTGIVSSHDIAYDIVNDQLYQLNEILSTQPRRVAVWNSISDMTAATDLVPDRQISGEAASLYGASTGLAIDPTR